jgi:hypothetical protein
LNSPIECICELADVIKASYGVSADRKAASGASTTRDRTITLAATQLRWLRLSPRRMANTPIIVSQFGDHGTDQNHGLGLD